MALYAIADLHLPLGINKPMEKFGAAWSNYVERLYDNWQTVIKPGDTVVIPGDFSWATYLEQSIKDFEYLNELNGKKILVKGNHDYWWSTMNKLKKFIESNGFKNIEFMHNNVFIYDDIALCGTRGWIHPEWDGFSGEDRKIFNREIERMRISLKCAEKLIESRECIQIYAFMHYPPVPMSAKDNEMSELLRTYNVKKVIYGHLHGLAHRNAVSGEHNGIEYSLVSADYLQFVPKKIRD